MAETKNVHQNSEQTVFHTEVASADDGDPQVTVAEVVAELEGKNTSELTPVYDAIDHFVSNLFSSPPPEAAQAQIEFTYEGYRITIHQDGMATFRKIA
ncbi:HalOD1 output domain-containing protein [Haladaptatus halobius]|uniref:HalOD1 output domain-containing protein n=1 Tax=Haladaptatus halobius TaxID=2884875 RepID=UPI001D09CC73|nr:HalOD1 output domain-containing protein [Haladaptatus halobius]